MLGSNCTDAIQRVSLPTKILYLNTAPKSGTENMQIDLDLLNQKLPVLRLYQWQPDCLSIGRFQDLSEINLQYCQKNNIDIIRRPTGGKTVLHGTDLTYSFIIDADLMPKSIIASYEIIANALILGLKNLGLAAQINPGKSKNPKNPICFAESSYNEIMINGKKIIGSAQKRLKNKILQHGSILLDIDYEKLANCFNAKDKTNLAKTLQSKITSLNRESPKKYNLEEITKAFVFGFKTTFSSKIIEISLPDNINIC
jgi:lipoate-protein ligase A